MKLDNEAAQSARPLPHATALANLAAQSRFAGLPDKTAVNAALALHREAQRVIEHEEKLADLWRVHCVERLENLREPTGWPAKFDDLLRTIVPGKDQGERQGRFNAFLRWQIRQAPCLYGIKPVRETKDPKTGEKKREYEVTDVILYEKVPKLLVEYKSKTYSKTEWRNLAGQFRFFWKRYVRQVKQRAGKKGAAAKQVRS
jgi:hypothetical protein